MGKPAKTDPNNGFVRRREYRTIVTTTMRAECLIGRKASYRFSSGRQSLRLKQLELDSQILFRVLPEVVD
jgi:hypothetical protein